MRPKAIGLVRTSHALKSGTPEIQGIAHRYATCGVGLEEFDRLLAWLKANPLPSDPYPRSPRERRLRYPDKTYLKCSCGEEVNKSGLRQHLKINKAHRPTGEKGYRHGCAWVNGLSDDALDRMVAEVREANSEPLTFRQGSFGEMFSESLQTSS